MNPRSARFLRLVLLAAAVAGTVAPARAETTSFPTTLTVRGQVGVGTGDFHEGTVAGGGFGVVAQYGLRLFGADLALRLTADRTFLGVESSSLDNPVTEQSIDTEGDFTSTRYGLHFVLPAGSFRTVAVEQLQPYLQLGVGAAVRDFCLTTTVRDLTTGDTTVNEDCDDRTQIQLTVAVGFLIRMTERFGLDLAAGMDVAFEEGLYQIQRNDKDVAPSPLFTASLGLAYRF